MRRFIASLVGIVLAIVVGAVPALAAEAVDATLADANLYQAVVDQLEADGIAYTADATSRRVQLMPEAHAGFTRLVANHRHIKDISGLEAFTCLRSIDLSNNLVTTSSQFAGMADLAYLDLYDNAVRDLDGLRGLAKLEHLNLGDNDERNRSTMTKLDALATLTSLRWLDFSRNQTPQVTTHIKNLTTLEYLDLADNSLKDVYDLEGLTSMKVLILNHNSGIAGLSSLKGMTELEELHCAFTHLNVSDPSYGTDTTGINELFGEDGKLLLTHLRKIDLLADWNTHFATDGKGLYPVENGHIQELYRMFKAGELEEFGYFYTWFDDPKLPDRYMRHAGYLHTDPDTGVKYISYEDFDAHCDGIHDDYYAIFNAHMYANTYGCEVRATIDSATAASKTFHVFNYHSWRDLTAYTNIDWQGTNFRIHDENIDHYPSRHFALLLLCLGPQGSVTGTTPYRRMKTIENKDASGAVIKDENGELVPFTLSGSLGTTSTSFRGLNAQFDAEMDALKVLGYQRFYVMVTNENKRQYMRHEGLNYRVNWDGYAQWDGFIVGADGTIETHNASELLPHGTTALSGDDYHAPDPSPVQWDFDGITKVQIIPIPAEQSHVRNAHFVTSPLASKAETPRDGGGKPQDYRRCLDFRYCTNLEIADITQTVGTPETNYDDNELSGSYYGFFTMSYCADVDFHDCAAWDRRALTSTYGIQLDQIVKLTLTRVSNSNPEEHLWGVGGNRWGNTGTNHIKHLLYDHCSLGRIDAHMGYYDLAVRDCDLGTGGFSLTGQGPLTIERSTTRSQSFINLRSDYGSTWDGDAHINDCTHYFLRSRASEQPGNFTASTPRFSKETQNEENRHDFGYPLRHPRLYVRNFTLDDSRFFGSDTEYYGTYGILSNYLNGLQYYTDYWPAVVDIDGLHMVNYEDSLGYERHVHLPLKMYGPARDQLEAGLANGNYRVTNVTYNGEQLSADLSQGVELFTMPLDLGKVNEGSSTPVIEQRALTVAEMAGRDIVIEYTGDEPDLALTDEPTYYNSNEHWITVKPYFVEHRRSATGERTEVAYFSYREIVHRWEKRLAEMAAAGDGDEFGPLARIQVRSTVLQASANGNTTDVTDYRTHVLHAQLLDTHDACVHEWGEWKQVWAPGCATVGEEQRVCAKDPTHIQRREVPAAGHDWSEPTYVWAADDSSVTATRVCARATTHVQTETAATTWEVLREPSQARPGELAYTATFTNEAFAPQTKTVEISALPPEVLPEAVRDVTDSEDNWGGAALDESGADLTQVVPISIPERKRLAEGTELEVWLKVVGLEEEDVPELDREATLGALGSRTVGAWFDASIFKRIVGDDEAVKMSGQLAGQIALRLSLPEDLRAPEGTVRSFAVVRVHGGVATLLPTTFDEDAFELVFGSDLFSTYAVAYADETSRPDEGEPGTPETPDDGKPEDDGGEQVPPYDEVGHGDEHGSRDPEPDDGSPDGNGQPAPVSDSPGTDGQPGSTPDETATGGQSGGTTTDGRTDSGAATAGAGTVGSDNAASVSPKPDGSARSQSPSSSGSANAATLPRTDDPTPDIHALVALAFITLLAGLGILRSLRDGDPCFASPRRSRTERDRS